MDADVIVIGAGMAGMTAARSLLRRGFSVTILERTAHAGGRVGTESLNGARIDTGAGFLANVYTNTRTFLRDLSLDGAEVPLGGRVAILREGQLRCIRSKDGAPGILPFPRLVRLSKA